MEDKNFETEFLTRLTKIETKLDDYKSVKDFIIDLEKLLQVFVAFKNNPLDAIQHKSQLLRVDSAQYSDVTNFIKNPSITSNDFVNLYLLYLRAEREKKNGDGKMPNPFYLIYCFSKYDCSRNPEVISELLKTKENVDGIIKKYSLVLRKYYSNWVKLNPGKEYNDMIKTPVDEKLLDEIKEDISETLIMMNQQQ